MAVSRFNRSICPGVSSVIFPVFDCYVSDFCSNRISDLPYFFVNSRRGSIVYDAKLEKSSHIYKQFEKILLKHIFYIRLNN